MTSVSDAQPHKHVPRGEIARFVLVLRRDDGRLHLDGKQPLAPTFETFSLVEREAFRNIVANIVNVAPELMAEADEYAAKRLARRRANAEH